MVEIADIISSVIQNINDVKITENFSKRVRALCDAFPIYEEQSVKI